MSPHVDFSSTASIYDRRHGTLLADGVAEALAAAANLGPGARVLDIGAGTGRVAIPFAEIGCHAVALDPSHAMLTGLRRKLSNSRVEIVAGGGTQLPFAGETFNGVIVARVLYLVAEWQLLLREACRVLRPGGALLHEWGNGQSGEEWVEIREKARSLFEEAGVHSPFHPGVRDEDELAGFLDELGLNRTRELSLGPGPPMTLRDFVGRIVSGELSYIWNVPQAVRESCLPVLVNWCEATFDLDRPVAIPGELRWAVYESRYPG